MVIYKNKNGSSLDKNVQNDKFVSFHHNKIAKETRNVANIYIVKREAEILRRSYIFMQ